MMNLIDYFDYIYSRSKYDKFGKVKIGIHHSIIRTLIRYIANAFIPVYLKFTQTPTLNSQKNNVIVSFTSFPLRIRKVWIVLESILRQDTQPQRVVLWLSKEQFKDFKSLPSSLLRYKRYGVEIKLVDEDYKSHKKYYYVMNDNPNSTIITIDDDIMYPSNMISNLLKTHSRYPNSIIARYAYKIEYDLNGNVVSYSKWKRIMKPEPPSPHVFFGSGGGTLFPVGSLNKDVINIDLAMRLCPTADDVFLNAQCQLNNTDVAVVDSYVALLNIQFGDNRRLAKDNVDEGNANDMQIKAIKKYYTSKRVF